MERRFGEKKATLRKQHHLYTRRRMCVLCTRFVAQRCEAFLFFSIPHGSLPHHFYTMASRAFLSLFSRAGGSRNILQAHTCLCRAGHAVPNSHKRFSVVSLGAPLHKRSFTALSRRFASATTPHSTPKNPAEDESQRHLEIGTSALEAGNVETAKVGELLYCHGDSHIVFRRPT